MSFGTDASKSDHQYNNLSVGKNASISNNLTVNGFIVGKTVVTDSSVMNVCETKSLSVRDGSIPGFVLTSVDEKGQTIWAPIGEAPQGTYFNSNVQIDGFGRIVAISSGNSNGQTGPTGPTGSLGPSGSAGPTGPTGPASGGGDFVIFDISNTVIISNYTYPPYGSRASYFAQSGKTVILNGAFTVTDSFPIVGFTGAIPIIGSFAGNTPIPLPIPSGGLIVGAGSTNDLNAGTFSFYITSGNLFPLNQIEVGKQIFFNVTYLTD